MNAEEFELAKTEGNIALEQALNEHKIRIVLHRMQDNAPDSSPSHQSIREVLVRIQEDNGKLTAPGEPGDGGFLDGASVEQKKRLTEEILRQLFEIIIDPSHPLSNSRFSVNLGAEELKNENLLSFLQKSIDEGTITKEILKNSFIFEVLETVDTSDENIAQNISLLHNEMGASIALDDFPPEKNLGEVLSELQEKGVQVSIVKIVHEEWDDESLKEFFKEASQYGVKIVIEKILLDSFLAKTKEKISSVIDPFLENLPKKDPFSLRVSQLKNIAMQAGFQGTILIQSWGTHRGKTSNIPLTPDKIREKMAA